MRAERDIACPYCGERNHVEAEALDEGWEAFTWDCAVCCRPMAIRVRLAGGRAPEWRVERELDGG